MYLMYIDQCQECQDYMHTKVKLKSGIESFATSAQNSTKQRYFAFTNNFFENSTIQI